jgi:hypothetical protein
MAAKLPSERASEGHSYRPPVGKFIFDIQQRRALGLGEPDLRPLLERRHVREQQRDLVAAIVTP